jgi:hypothetical protein
LTALGGYLQQFWDTTKRRTREPDTRKRAATAKQTIATATFGPVTSVIHATPARKNTPPMVAKNSATQPKNIALSYGRTRRSCRRKRCGAFPRRYSEPVAAKPNPDLDERISIPLDPELAIRALLQTGPHPDDDKSAKEVPKPAK